MKLLRALFQPLRGKDVALHAAAVTFYGGIAVVPVALLAVWLTALLAGADRVRRLTATPLAELPDDIGAGRAATVLIEAGLDLTPMLALAALVPATFYGEGFRRALISLTDPDTRGQKFTGWRGRLLLLPLFAAAPALLFALLLVLPSATRLLREGGSASVAGIGMSFLATMVMLAVVLGWIFRVVAPEPPRWSVTAVGATFTAAHLSGFLHGFILFCSLPLDLGVPFGGLDAVGAVVAVALWLYLLHLLVIVGYAVTLQFDRRWTLRTAHTNIGDENEGQPDPVGRNRPGT